MLASVVAASDLPPTTYTFPSMHTAAHPYLATLMSGKARHCPVDVSYISALFKEEPPSCPPITYTFPSIFTAAHPFLATLICGKARHCPADGSCISALFSLE